MSQRFPRFGLPLLLLFVFSTQACDRENATAPTEPTALTGTQTTFTVEPVPLRAEFLPGGSCSHTRPFGTRIVFIVSSGGGGFVRGFHFRFSDRFGVHALPRVAAIPGSSPMTTPVSSIPTFVTTAAPGIAPMPPVTTAPPTQSQTFPFFLTFDCSVVPSGTLFVSIDEAGGPRELSVRVGS